jgi:hypothetical protein
MEGTGTLFAHLLQALPSTLNAVTVSYPRQQFLGYSDLLSFLTERVPKADPFVLLAESFSTPLAVKFAATHPANITDNGSDPVRWLRLQSCSSVAILAPTTDTARSLPHPPPWFLS